MSVSKPVGPASLAGGSLDGLLPATAPKRSRAEGPDQLQQQPDRVVVPIIVLADGRQCRFCGTADTADDPVAKALGWARADGNKSITYAWFTDKPKHNKPNEGMVCYYCYTVFGSRYKHRGFSMDAALAEIGSSLEKTSAFKALKQGLIDWCIQNGGRGGRVQWSFVQQRSLVSQQIQATTYEDPVDEHWDLAEYIREKGNPETNGLNHQVKSVEGRKIVVVPGKLIWKVKRSRTNQAVLNTVIDDGTCVFGENQLEEKAVELGQLLKNMMPAALGAVGHCSLSMLLAGSGGGSSDSAAPTSAPASAQQASSGSGSGASSSTNGFMPFGFMPLSSLVGSGGGTAVRQLGDGGASGGAAQATHPPQTGIAPAQPKAAAGGRRTRAVAKQSPGPLGGACGAAPQAQASAGSVASAGGGAGSGSDKKKIGRPKRDLNIATDQVVQEFAQISDEGSASFNTWFGTEAKSNRRTMKRLLDDLSKQADATEDMAEFGVLTVQKKKIEVVLGLTDFIAKSGVSHVGLVETVDAQNHYMSLAPKVEVKLPSYVSSNYFLLRSRGVPDAEGFWQCIRDAKMHFPAEVAQRKQANLIGERIIAITKSDAMQKTLEEFFPKDVSSLQFEGEIEKQLLHVACLTWHSTATAAELKQLAQSLSAAILSTDNAKDVITHSLTVFPAGRTLIAQASAFKSQVDLTVSWVDSLLEGLGAAERSLRLEALQPHPTLESLEKSVLDAERTQILKQHFNELVTLRVSEVVRQFTQVGVENFASVALPFFRGECTWEGWAKTGDISKLCSFLDAFVKCQCITAAPFCMDITDELAAVKKLGEILYVINKVHAVDAWLKPDAWDKESLAVRSLLSKGFSMSPEVERVIGSEAFKDIVAFEGGAFKAQSDLAIARVSDACREVAKATCCKLFEGLDAAFGTDRVMAVDIQSKGFAQKLGKWELSHEEMRSLIRLGVDCEDELFCDELSFIQALLSLLQSSTPLLSWWQKTLELDSEDKRSEAQIVTEESAKWMGDVRSQLVHFRSVSTTSTAGVLFASDTASLLAPLLHGRFAARAVSDSVVQAVESLLADIGAKWSSINQQLADNVSKWVPSSFHCAEKRKTLLSDADDVAAELLGNKFYRALPDACNLLSSLRGLCLPFLSDGTGLPPPVSRELLGAMDTNRCLGVQCVTWTFGLYIAAHQLPKIANDTARADQVAEFLKAAKLKGCMLDGSDLKRRLSELAKPGAVAATAGPAEG